MTVIGHGADLCTSTTRPASPSTGALIFETDTMSYRWYTGTAWESIIPVGTTQSFAGATAPTGWLLCFGQALNSVTNPEYAALYAVIGTTYGGTGNTNFLIPDLRGRVTVGKDNMGGTASNRITSAGSSINGTTLGASGGNELLQQHNHAVTDPGHNHNITDPGHAHNYYYNRSLAGYGLPYPNYGNAVYTNDYGKAMSYEGTGISIQNKVTGITINNTGTGTTGSNNVQPTLITNYIIKV